MSGNALASLAPAAAGQSNPDPATGVIDVVFGNDKQITMPFTGSPTLLLVLLAGAALVAMSVYSMRRNARREADAAGTGGTE